MSLAQEVLNTLESNNPNVKANIQKEIDQIRNEIDTLSDDIEKKKDQGVDVSSLVKRRQSLRDKINDLLKQKSEAKEEPEDLGYYYKNYGIGHDDDSFIVYSPEPEWNILHRCNSEKECKAYIDKHIKG